MEDIIKKLKNCKSFRQYLLFIKNTEGLVMVQDNGWFWLEFEGDIIEGSGSEKFTSSSDMNDLMAVAGIL